MIRTLILSPPKGLMLPNTNVFDQLEVSANSTFSTLLKGLDNPSFSICWNREKSFTYIQNLGNVKLVKIKI